MLRPCVLVLALLLGKGVLAAPFPAGVPAGPNEPITDLAHMFSAERQDTLNSILRQSFQGHEGLRVAVLTLETLNGQDIKAVSKTVAEAWALGRSKQGGVLLLICPREGALFLDGAGKLEKDTSPEIFQNIYRKTMLPLLGRGLPDDALSAGLAQLFAKLAPESPESGLLAQAEEKWSADRMYPRRAYFKGKLLSLILFIALAIAVIYVFGLRKFNWNDQVTWRADGKGWQDGTSKGSE